MMTCHENTLSRPDNENFTQRTFHPTNILNLVCYDIITFVSRRLTILTVFCTVSMETYPSPRYDLYDVEVTPTIDCKIFTDTHYVQPGQGAFLQLTLEEDLFEGSRSVR